MPFDRTRPAALSFRVINGWRGPGEMAIARFGVASDLVARLESIARRVDLFFIISGLWDTHLSQDRSTPRLGAA